MAPIPFYGHNPVKLGYKVIKIVNVKTFLNIQGPLYILRSYCLLTYCGYMVDKNSNQLWFPTFFLNINNGIETLVTFKVLCHPLITCLTNIYHCRSIWTINSSSITYIITLIAFHSYSPKTYLIFLSPKLASPQKSLSYIQKQIIWRLLTHRPYHQNICLSFGGTTMLTS